MKLISNEYRCCSMSDPAISREVNETKGCDLDPLDRLIQLEARACALWEAEQPNQSRHSFIDQYVSMAIASL